jgi:hypothetical protein
MAPPLGSGGATASVECFAQGLGTVSVKLVPADW